MEHHEAVSKSGSSSQPQSYEVTASATAAAAAAAAASHHRNNNGSTNKSSDRVVQIIRPLEHDRKTCGNEDDTNHYHHNNHHYRIRNHNGTLLPSGSNHSREPFMEGEEEGSDGEEDSPATVADIPSNEKLLGTAFVTFMTFALTQLLFAYIAGSEAMMGDSAAMIVDSLTYLFNYFAERRKDKFDQENQPVLPTTDESDPEALREVLRIRERTKRKIVLQLEVIPPIISVTTLIFVTIFVTKKALHILFLDMHRSIDQQKKPNVNLMLTFSLFNLGLDGLNVFCFARAKHLLGFATHEEDDDDDVEDHDDLEEQKTNNHRHTPPTRRKRKRRRRRRPQISGEFYKQVRNDSPNTTNLEDTDEHDPIRNDGDDDGSDVEAEDDRPEKKAGTRRSNSCVSNNSNSSSRYQSDNGDEDDSPTSEHPQREHANLNMCSAYTHVFADTLRSIAVIIAAGLAELFPNFTTPEEADAAAAVVVSMLILLSLVPLIQGLIKSVSELRAIIAEERSEAMFPQASSVPAVSSSLELT